MPTENLKPAKSANPKWLDTARLFYSDSFGALKKRELRASKDDWSDLTEEEQSFALAHLQYLDLMAQAGTQRLLVQIRDLLEEVADGMAAFRDRAAEGVGEEDEGDDDGDGYSDDYGDEEGEPEPGFEPPPVQLTPPFAHPIPKDEPARVAAPASDNDDDGGGRAA